MADFLEFSYYRKDLRRSVPLLLNVANVVALTSDGSGQVLVFTLEGGDPWPIDGTFEAARAKLRTGSRPGVPSVQIPRIAAGATKKPPPGEPVGA